MNDREHNYRSLVLVQFYLGSNEQSKFTIFVRSIILLTETFEKNQRILPNPGISLSYSVDDKAYLKNSKLYLRFRQTPIKPKTLFNRFIVSTFLSPYALQYYSNLTLACFIKFVLNTKEKPRKILCCSSLSFRHLTFCPFFF